MADISPQDCRAKRTGACHTIESHHQEVIQSNYDRSIQIDPNEPMNYLLRGARYLKLHNIEKALIDVENFARIKQSGAIRQDKYLDKRLRFILIRNRFLKSLIDPLVKDQVVFLSGSLGSA